MSGNFGARPFAPHKCDEQRHKAKYAPRKTGPPATNQVSSAVESIPQGEVMWGFNKGAAFLRGEDRFDLKYSVSNTPVLEYALFLNMPCS